MKTLKEIFENYFEKDDKKISRIIFNIFIN